MLSFDSLTLTRRFVYGVGLLLTKEPFVTPQLDKLIEYVFSSLSKTDLCKTDLTEL